MKKEILFGIHPVKEALRAGKRKIFEIFVTRQSLQGRARAIADKAAGKGIPVTVMEPSGLKKLTGSSHHQHIGAKVSIFKPASLNDVLKKNKKSKKSKDPFLLILDSILDVHNMGALIRTALCAGTDGVIIPKNRSAKPLPAVSKASSGAMEHMGIVEVVNLKNTIQNLKKRGIWAVGLDMAGDITIFEADLKGPLAVIIGGEEKGIRPIVKKECDFLAQIPQKGPLDSLNASVAGAVIMYEALRQRKK